eukprot:scaffold53619_cov35-Attheya_sp.AAC.1
MPQTGQPKGQTIVVSGNHDQSVLLFHHQAILSILNITNMHKHSNSQNDEHQIENKSEPTQEEDACLSSSPHQPWNSLDSAALPKDLRKSQRQVMMPGIEPGTTGASPEVNTNHTTSFHPQQQQASACLVHHDEDQTPSHIPSILARIASIRSIQGDFIMRTPTKKYLEKAVKHG